MRSCDELVDVLFGDLAFVIIDGATRDIGTAHLIFATGDLDGIPVVGRFTPDISCAP